MELGLACSVCSHLNPLRAVTCDRCNASLAPRPVAAAGATGGLALNRTPSAPVAAAPVVGATSSAEKLMGTMSLPTVQPVPPTTPPTISPTISPTTSPTTSPTISPATPPVGPTSPSLARSVGPLGSGVQSVQQPVHQHQAVQQQVHPAQQAPRFNALTGLPEGPMGAGKPAAKTMFFGALQQQAVVPRLVVIKGEGGDGVTYHLSAMNHTVGRSTGDIRFSEDLFLNPEHARFTVQGGRLFVKDMTSVNGVFVRIKSPVQLEHGDYFLVGEQLLRLDSEPFGDGGPDPTGTYSYSSPRPEGKFRVSQQLAGGGEGRIVSAQGAALTMGREGNTLNFPQDRFISGRHARLDAASDSHHVILTDTGSRNGTFVRTKGALELFHGDYLFVGQQLLRVEIS